jgi:hypothetical protein
MGPRPVLDPVIFAARGAKGGDAGYGGNPAPTILLVSLRIGTP